VNSLRPVKAAALRWHRPEALGPERFEKLRPRLLRLASEPSEALYVAKRRALYRVEDDELGAVAIKEIRSQGLARALWFRFARQHPALREFRVGAAFEARGGPTHEFFAVAIERSGPGIQRGLLFFRWLDDAVDLTQQLRHSAGKPAHALLANVARGLAAHARLGLVHGRHAPGNLLLLPRPGGIEVLAIDFAYASLGPGFDEAGYVGDVSRVAHHLVEFGLCSRPTAREFLELCAEEVAEADDVGRVLGLLAADTDRRLEQRGVAPLCAGR